MAKTECYCLLKYLILSGRLLKFGIAFIPNKFLLTLLKLILVMRIFLP